MKAIVLHKGESKLAIIAAIPLKYIINSVQFTQREFSTWSDNEAIDTQFSKFYQRPTNLERLKSIRKYISESLYENSNQQILFPTTMLLALDLYENDINIDENDLVELNFIDHRNDILIVDGQHRMKALQSLYYEYEKNGDNKKFDILKDFKLNCTFLINYDIWDQARIFADVNFTQKPVDKSLYYDIFGEFYDEKKSNNTLYVAHQLGKFLNKNERSPLKGFVKDFRMENGFVSQAFLTSSLMSLLGPRGPWSYIDDNFKKDPSYQTKVPNIIVGYFNVIKREFHKYWPRDLNKQNSTILSKTTALGALIKLLGLLDDRLRKGLMPNYGKINLLELSQDEIEKTFTKIFEKFKDANEDTLITQVDRLFGENSSYLGGGSAGLQSKLYKEMAGIIGIPLK